MRWIHLSTAAGRVKLLDPEPPSAPVKKGKKKKRAVPRKDDEAASSDPDTAPSDADTAALAVPDGESKAADPDGIRAVLALIRFGIVKHGPRIAAAMPRRSFALGPGHRAFLLGDVKSTGAIPYAWLLAVFANGAMTEPTLVVSSEGKTVPLGEGSHFLVVTDAGGRGNRGASDAWADEGQFTAEALRLAASELGVDVPPEAEAS